MGSCSSPHLFILLLFVFFLFCDCSQKAFDSYAERFHVTNVQSLRPSTACSASKGVKQRGLTVSHRYGPCSPLGRKKVSTRQILLQDQARVKSLQSRYSNASRAFLDEKTTLPANLGVAVGILNYVVTVQLGSLKKEMTVAFDTGSDLTWVQCQPCAGGTGCYKQRDPYFNPTESTSYASIACNSLECSKLPSSTGRPASCSSSQCYYSTSYGDGSETEGFYAEDTLTISSDSIQRFRFGCGQKNKGLFGEAAGLLGLGREDLSLVSQTAQKFGKVFSYCLPSSSSDSGFLTFGPGTSSEAKFTPLLTNSDAPSFYFVNMMGILVGGKELSIPASTFSSPGTILDSGTLISRLPPAAYSELRTTFRSQLSNYTLVQPYQIFDTCYDFSQYETVDIPTIALRFSDGVDIDVSITGILYYVKASQICLAFAPNSDQEDLAIIGNRQQRTYEVVHDVASGRIGFAAGKCS
ncbi:aspartyl protease family protein At5g10770-like [Aristolochia californica]|uniref:aspartyl protease family protein At5g10770-like n=1 Tax=Aristolochia californica TaxID=171875 RepID=UPI0035D64AC8